MRSGLALDGAEAVVNVRMILHAPANPRGVQGYVVGR